MALDFSGKPLIGMLHLAGEDPAQQAYQEMQIYRDEGLDGVIVENYHGNYVDMLDFIELTEGRELGIDVGINFLPKDTHMIRALTTAFALASSSGFEFVQLDYVAGRYDGAMLVDPDYLSQIRTKSSGVQLLGGVLPKYYRWSQDAPIDDWIRQAADLSDAVVVTGEATGVETPLEKLAYFRERLPHTPMIVGAGVDVYNITSQLELADGAIIGSAFKPDNDTRQPVDPQLVRKLVVAANNVRS